MVKTVVLTLLVLAAPVLGGTIDALVAFDASKLKSEEIDGATAFRYEGGDVSYVEHGEGAPVIPCRHVYVVAPKGAAYKGCRTKVTREQIPGQFKLYTRNPKSASASGAKIFPPQVVEYVKTVEDRGFTLFLFRVYPVICQPADGTVMRVHGLQLQVSCEGDARYEDVLTENLAAIKAKVLNPRSLETLVASLKVRPAAETASKSGFATKGARGRNAYAGAAGQGWQAGHSGSRSAADGDLLETLKQNRVSFSDGSLMFTPISF